MRSEKMWKELAKYYDLIYSWKPYEKESETIHKLIQKHKRSKGSELLDVACGTGNHIKYLKKHYKISGTDLNRDMLAVAKKKFPKLKFYQSDMARLNIKNKFDVIICLFSSIGYVRNYTGLKKAISSFSGHLKKGGVLVIEPFIRKEAYIPGESHGDFVNRPDVKICRMNLSKKRGNIAILDFHFLIATKKGIGYFRDKHELGLFDTKKFLEILRDQGFRARFLKNGLMKDRGLYVAVKK